MSKIKLTGSNSGYVEIDSAADAGNLTLQLPTSGTKLLSNAANVFTGPAEIAFTLIWSAPMLFARYLVVDSKAAFATPMTLQFGKVLCAPR